MPFIIKFVLLSEQPECISWPFFKLFSDKKTLQNDLEISSSVSLVIIRTNPCLPKSQANTDQSNPFIIHNKHSPSSSTIFGRNTLPPLTTDLMNLLRQQMDESNHEIVDLLTQQIGTVFNPLIRDTNWSYQALTT